MRHWQDAGGYRCRRAAGGTAGRVFEVPWVVTGTIEPRLGIRVQAELGGRAAADEHESGLIAARHIGGVMVGDKILEQAAAEGRRLTGLEKAEVLDQIRHALQRPVGKPRCDRFARLFILQVAKPDGLVVVDPATELEFLHDLPVELMWGVGPVTKARLAEMGVLTIGQLARLPRGSLEPLLGDAAYRKLAALAWNRDPREIATHRRARSAGAQSALGKKPAKARVFRPTLRHLADRVGSRLRAKSRLGRTVSVRVRFADLRAVTRSVTLPAPISATATLAEIAEDLVRCALADHPDEQTISLLAISVSNLEDRSTLQLEFPLGLADEERRPGTKKGLARLVVDCAVDTVRYRFGWEAIGYALEEL